MTCYGRILNSHTVLLMSSAKEFIWRTFIAAKQNEAKIVWECFSFVRPHKDNPPLQMEQAHGVGKRRYDKTITKTDRPEISKIRKKSCRQAEMGGDYDRPVYGTKNKYDMIYLKNSLRVPFSQLRPIRFINELYQALNIENKSHFKRLIIFGSFFVKAVYCNN